MAKPKIFMVPIQFTTTSSKCNFCGTWNKRCVQRNIPAPNGVICLDCVKGISDALLK